MRTILGIPFRGLALAGCLLLAACGGGAEPSPPADPPAAPPAAPAGPAEAMGAAVKECEDLCEEMARKAEACLTESGRAWGPDAAGEGGDSLSSREGFVSGCRGQMIGDMGAAACASARASLAAGRLGCEFISPRLWGGSLPSGSPLAAPPG
ncbi:hypothetical protein L6R50_14230 [Myxococcota bacterium]|nr:hypothetical protein [Myxococcota bacterium]